MKIEAFYFTLKEALLRGIQLALDLAEREIDGLVTKYENDPSKYEIIIYETAEGGVGAIKTLTEASGIESVVEKARELLHENDRDGGCKKACYECLLSYYNQREHMYMDRNLVLPLLAQLEKVEIIGQDVGGSTTDKLDELLSKCESNLEKEVIRRINDEGLPLPDESQYLIYDRDRRVARADFYYPDSKIVVFVDGPPHDQDYVKKDDQKKRNELKALGYRINVIHYSDVERGIIVLKNIFN